MSELIISVSGLRGVIGESLTFENAARYAAAFSESVEQPGPFVISRDSRPSGAVLADAIHSVLNSIGRSTIDADITATPTTGVVIRCEKAAGGIQISASHNPAQFNGMKLFSSEGRVIPKEQGKKVLERYTSHIHHWVSYAQLGKRTYCCNTNTAHLRLIGNTINVENIAKHKFRVLLDSNHGAGASLASWLFDILDCEPVILGGNPTGDFIHTPEPTEENLREVCRKVKEANVDVAFCQDPDADRVAVIDGNGRYIGEEYTVALCLEHLLKTASEGSGHPFKREKGPVVINCATSRMNEDIAAKYGVPLYRSAVGEANVVDMMLDKKAFFGGEGNGGPIDPKVGYVRDSYVGMALVLDAMAAAGKTVAQLADELPHYELVKRKTPADLSKVQEMLDKVAEKFKHLPCSKQDGLRIDHGDSWVLLRGSNTEPIIRLFAEAPARETAEKLCDDVEEILKK